MLTNYMHFLENIVNIYGANSCIMQNYSFTAFLSLKKDATSCFLLGNLTKKIFFEVVSFRLKPILPYSKMRMLFMFV